tara:strand:- start:2866 stop:4065 length:1200 start_codon:yes stop_codon:yes gene_type:complete
MKFSKARKIFKDYRKFFKNNPGAVLNPTQSKEYEKAKAAYKAGKKAKKKANKSKSKNPTPPPINTQSKTPKKPPIPHRVGGALMRNKLKTLAGAGAAVIGYNTMSAEEEAPRPPKTQGRTPPPPSSPVNTPPAPGQSSSTQGRTPPPPKFDRYQTQSAKQSEPEPEEENVSDQERAVASLGESQNPGDRHNLIHYTKGPGGVDLRKPQEWHPILRKPPEGYTGEPNYFENLGVDLGRHQSGHPKRPGRRVNPIQTAEWRDANRNGIEDRDEGIYKERDYLPEDAPRRRGDMLLLPEPLDELPGMSGGMFGNRGPYGEIWEYPREDERSEIDPPSLGELIQAMAERDVDEPEKSRHEEMLEELMMEKILERERKEKRRNLLGEALGKKEWEYFGDDEGLL